MKKKKVITCPFCNYDLTGAHMTVKEANVPGIRVSLCLECGEPVIFTDKGFRRPTEDEYVGLYEQTNVREARDAFAAMKEGEVQDAVRKMWVKYFLHRLKPSLNSESFNTNEKVYDCLQDVFMSGAAMILAYMKKAVHDAETRGQVIGQMAALEIEIEAYCQYVRGDRSA